MIGVTVNLQVHDFILFLLIFGGILVFWGFHCFIFEVNVMLKIY
jgi:hypothetical protein